jgi:hypothetical protein
MARLPFVLLCALALSFYGCGDDSGTGTDGGGGGDGGGGTDGGGGGDGGGTDGAVMTDGGGTDAPTGTECTSPLVGCTATEYCDFPDNLCGTGAPGVCRPRPTTCGAEEEPACNCQPLVFMNSCLAQMGGFDLNDTTSCTFASGVFACGHRGCRTDMEYCQRQVSDEAGVADTYECITLPSGCSDCTCLASVTCGDMCAMAGAGELTVTCPGG